MALEAREFSCTMIYRLHIDMASDAVELGSLHCNDILLTYANIRLNCIRTYLQGDSSLASPAGCGAARQVCNYVAASSSLKLTNRR